MKKTDIAYFAGIVDGEGYIGIYIIGKRRQYHMEVGVSNTNFWLLSQLKFAFNGTIRGPYSGGRCLIWRVTDKQALIFLETLLPYLHLKRPQAELAIRFQKRKRNTGRAHISDGEIALREAERILCHNLKTQ